MNYANLIQNITENIKTNGSQAITAQVLQDVLVEMVQEMGQSGALLGGVIDTSFVPDSTNDAQVVYIAEAPGTYTNFNGLVVGAGEVAFFYFDGNAWAKSSVDVLEVVNDLTSTATDKALSAAMGKQLQDSLTQAVQDLTTAIGNKADRQTTEQALNTLQNQINDKADTTYVNSQLATKADTASVNAALALKADTSAVNAALATKADTSALATKADKVVGAVAGNMASLDASGNLVDSGINSSAVGDVANKIDRVVGAEVGNVAAFDAMGGIEDSGVAADNIAEQDGYYETMVVGGAENLIGSDIVASQFTRRKTGGSTDAGTGVAILKTIKGNTLVWNQRVTRYNNTQTSLSVTATFSEDGTIALSGTATGGTATFSVPGLGNYSDFIQGHKYLLWGCPSGGANATYSIRYNNNGYGETGAGVIVTCASGGSGYLNRAPIIAIANGVDATGLVFKPQMIDLTQEFGSGSEPSTVAEFRAFFPLSLYDSVTPFLLNNKAASLVTTGFNQWDEEWESGKYNTTTGEPEAAATQIRSKNYIPVFGNTDYYFQFPLGVGNLVIMRYDIDKNYLGYNAIQPSIRSLNAETRYIRFYMTVTYGATYKNDICINLSDANKNGTYEPYWTETKALPITTATSGGVAIFPDGMKSAGTAYDETDGVKAVKRIGSRAYQAGDESDTSVKTDGTTTYYALPTPTEYTLDTPFNGQYRVDNDGTETILPENTSTPTTSPMVADINYALNAIDTIRNLPQNYISKASMDAILTAFKTAGVITNYTLTWDATNQKYNCTITA